jgi:hypothetical protein
VSALLNIEIGDYADFEFTEGRIKRVKVKQSDFRLLFPEEKVELLRVAKSLRLKLPCAPRSLVAWAKCNGHLESLPAAFLEELGKRSEPQKKRGRPPVSNELQDRIRLAATKFLQKVPQDKFGEWSPRKIAFHGNFIQQVWPDNKNRASVSNSARPYRQAYGVGLRTVEDIIRAVKADFLSAQRVQINS